MKLLNDEMLRAYVDRPEPLLVKGLKKPTAWFDKDSPVQPSSIDLHVGSIFLPGTKHGLDGSEDKPLTTHTLGPGRTALITTLETLNLPSDVAAIGFPPSRVSAQGILMTNPGHIDPGYVGPMHFTVINMGRQEFNVRHGDMIVTVLFFEMLSAPKRDWTMRTGSAISGSPKQEDINRLSADFLDVTSRAENVARQEIGTAGLQLKQLETREKIALAIMAALVGAAGWLGSWSTGADELRARVAKLEQVQSTFESSINLERRLAALESRSSVQPATNSSSGGPIRQGTPPSPQSRKGETKKEP